ncbi:MAG TPA: ABC transporter permease [Pontiella sp.]|nr:ABC transporter permease [Pontiella sp.]
MKSILTIGHNDLRLFLRDKTAFIWLFVIPLVFIYFISFSSRPPGEPWDVNPKVLIENNDTGYMSQLFLEALGQQGLDPVMTGEEDAADVKRGLTIPVGFTENVLSKNEAKMSFFEISGSSDSDLRSNLVEINLIRTIIAFNSHLVEHATATGSKEPTETAIRKLIEAENPVQMESKFAGRKPIPVGFNMSLPGIIVMYIMLNLLIFGGAGMAAERRTGVLRRISINPITHLELMAGKMYGLMLLGAVQIAGFLAFGQFIFKVNIGDNLFGITVTLLVFAWVAASFGLLIGSLIKSEEKIVGLGIMISIPMAALGGCWWPMEIVPEALQKISHITPSAWAMDSLHMLITFGAGFKDVLKPVGVLAIYASAANLISARYFRI